MEKLLFKFTQSLHRPQYIITMFLALLAIGLVPLAKMILPQGLLLVYSVVILLPLVLYFSSLLILFFFTMPEIISKVKTLSTIDNNVLTVKTVARTMNISVRKAFIVLELAERSGNYSRTNLKYTLNQ